ncbi:MAG: efflux RND transporter periplasmic adaptor subunit [Acidobacteriota bacterium]
MKKLLRTAAFFLVLMLLALAAWQVRGWLARPPEVEVVDVVERDVRRVLALTGRIRPEKSNQMIPAVRARLLDLTREEGQAVRTGEVLARLDDRQARADLAQAQSVLRRDQDELDQRRRDLERATALAGEHLLPTSDLEAARLAAARSQRRVEEGGEVLAELTARLDDYVLRSPLDGFVLERPVDPGQVVGPTDVLYELATASDPEVEMEVDERYLGEIVLGQAALVAPLGRHSEPWPAEISYIGRRIDRLSGAAIVRLKFAGEPPDLPVGLTLDANLAIAEHPGALTVPRAAVSGIGGEAWVLVVEDGQTRRRAVEVIDWPAPEIVVRSGLRSGERIVLDPRQITAGTEVRATLVDPSAGAPEAGS